MLGKPTLDAKDTFTAPFLGKSTEWAYEEEVRIFRPEGPGVMQYDRDALACVIFGCRCGETDVAFVRSVLAGTPDTKFCAARAVHQSYSLVLHEID